MLRLYPWGHVRAIDPEDMSFYDNIASSFGAVNLGLYVFLENYLAPIPVFGCISSTPTGFGRSIDEGYVIHLPYGMYFKLYEDGRFEQSNIDF